MMFSRHVSLRRGVKLLRADLIQYRNNLSIAAAAVFGVLLVILVAWAESAGEWDPHEVFVPIVLFGGGFIITSLSFIELGDPVRRSAYLMVPASTLEKLATRLLLTLVGFPLAVIALYWVSFAAGHRARQHDLGRVSRSLRPLHMADGPTAPRIPACPRRRFPWRGMVPQARRA